MDHVKWCFQDIKLGKAAGPGNIAVNITKSGEPKLVEYIQPVTNSKAALGSRLLTSK